MKKWIIVSAMVVALLFAQTARAELVVNGGFQTQDNNWFGWTQNIYEMSWGNGEHAAAFSYFSGTLTQSIPTVDGTSYTFAFLLKHDSIGGTQNIEPLQPATQALVASWNTSPVFVAPIYNFDWTPYSLTVTATGPSSTISFAGQDTGGYYFLDNVSVNQVSSVPIPAAVWLLGSGLLGMAGLRRFRRISR